MTLKQFNFILHSLTLTARRHGETGDWPSSKNPRVSPTKSSDARKANDYAYNLQSSGSSAKKRLPSTWRWLSSMFYIRNTYVHSNPAIRHLKGPNKMMLYCRRIPDSQNFNKKNGNKNMTEGYTKKTAFLIVGALLRGSSELRSKTGSGESLRCVTSAT